MKKVVFLFVLCSCFHLQAIHLDSVIQSLSTLSDSSRIDSVIRIARQYSMKDDGINGEPLARWALNEAYANNFKDLIPKARFYLASAYDNQAMVDSCITNYDKALIEMKGTAHENWEIHVYINCISNYRNHGRYKDALNSGFKALEYYRERKDTFAIAQFTSDIGYVYDRMQEFEKALEWQRKALQLYILSDNSYKINVVKARIGIAHDDLGNYDSAHYYNQQALTYNKLSGDEMGEGAVSSNIGNTYIKQENWKKALDYIQRAHAINTVNVDLGNIAISGINLGNVHTHLGNYKDARKFLGEGINAAKEWGGLKFESEGHFRLHELFIKLGQFDSSLYYYKQYEALEDSLYGIEKTKQLVEMSTKYETKEKENQLALQELTIKEKDSKLLARQRMILMLVLLSIIILIVSVGLYQRYKAKKEAELQKLIIEEQEKGLRAVINAQEEERKRIAKDLHDGVGQQLSGLKMAFQKVAKLIREENPERSEQMKDLSSIVSESADEVRAISHQMMPRALTELGLIEAIKDMLQKSFAHADIQYDFDYYKIEERIDEKIEISLYRVCQELINNIIKHSEASHVSVQLFKNKGKVILVVEDNGKGFRQSTADGHGLLNIKSRVNTLNGDLNLEPSPNSGTLATIRIPIKE